MLEDLAFLRRRYRIQRRSYYQPGFNHYGPYWQERKGNIVVGGLLGICCAGFLAHKWALSRAQNLNDHKPLAFIENNFVCSQENIKAGRWWVGLTSSLMHFGPLHLGANMYTLWSFGPYFITLFGVPAFIGVWIASEACCTTVWLWYDQRRQDAQWSSVGRKWDKRGQAEERRWFAPKPDRDIGHQLGGSIGASGAISGMLAAMTCYYPKMTVLLFPLPVPFPAWGYTLAFAAGSLYCMNTGALPTIGHAGHLGGVLGGIASFYGLIRPWLRRTGRL